MAPIQECYDNSKEPDIFMLYSFLTIKDLFYFRGTKSTEMFCVDLSVKSKTLQSYPVERVRITDLVAGQKPIFALYLRLENHGVKDFSIAANNY